jgi:hypothetical protein
MYMKDVLVSLTELFSRTGFLRASRSLLILSLATRF